MTPLPYPAVEALFRRSQPGFPKQGRHSVGVARQYCGQLGKEDDCQVAVLLSLANNHASLPVAYRLYRHSPNENAHPRLFLLGERQPEFVVPETLTARMTHPPGTPGTIYPCSGISDEDVNFTHPDDIAAAKEVVAHAAHADAAALIHGMFDDLARKNSGNRFLTIKTGGDPRPNRRRALPEAIFCAN